MIAAKNTCCSHCGAGFVDVAWPRVCQACGATTWRNPTPVAVLLLPVDSGVLVIERGLPDGHGKLALPGGFVDFGETWQEAAVRELREEAGVVVDAADVELITVVAPRPRGDQATLLVFGRGPRLMADALPAFTATDEIRARRVVNEAVPLAFPSHTEVLASFFAKR